MVLDTPQASAPLSALRLPPTHPGLSSPPEFMDEPSGKAERGDWGV